MSPPSCVSVASKRWGPQSDRTPGIEEVTTPLTTRVVTPMLPGRVLFRVF